MKKYQKINNKKPPKLFLGGAAGISAIASIIGAGASLFGSISSANAQEKLAEQQMKDRERENLLKKIDQDKDVLRTYPVGGKQLTYYKRGGLISAKQGRTRVKPVPKLEGGGTVPDFNAYRKKYATPKSKAVTKTNDTETPARNLKNEWIKSLIIATNHTGGFNAGAIPIINTPISGTLSLAWDKLRGKNKDKRIGEYYTPNSEEVAYARNNPLETGATEAAGMALGYGAGKYVLSPIFNNILKPVLKPVLTKTGTVLKNAAVGSWDKLSGVGSNSTKRVIKKISTEAPRINLRDVPKGARKDVRTMLADAGYKPISKVHWRTGKRIDVKADDAVKFANPKKIDPISNSKAIPRTTSTSTPTSSTTTTPSISRKPDKVYSYTKSDGTKGTITIPYAERSLRFRALNSTLNGIDDFAEGVARVGSRAKKPFIETGKEMAHNVKMDFSKKYNLAYRKTRLQKARIDPKELGLTPKLIAERKLELKDIRNAAARDLRYSRKYKRLAAVEEDLKLQKQLAKDIGKPIDDIGPFSANGEFTGNVGPFNPSQENLAAIGSFNPSDKGQTLRRLYRNNPGLEDFITSQRNARITTKGTIGSKIRTSTPLSRAKDAANLKSKVDVTEVSTIKPETIAPGRRIIPKTSNKKIRSTQRTINRNKRYAKGGIIPEEPPIRITDTTPRKTKFKKYEFLSDVPGWQERSSGKINQSDLNIEDILLGGLAVKQLFKYGLKKATLNKMLQEAKAPRMHGSIDLGNHPKTVRRISNQLFDSESAYNAAIGGLGANATTYAIDRAYGGSSDSSLPKRNTKKLSPVADLITNGKGTTSGTHEQGYDIPVKRNGRTTAYVEPGEVALKTNNGSKYILSKRTGFAQKYMDLEAKRQALATLKSRTTGLKGNMVKLQLDNIVREMQSLPAKQEQLNAGKKPKVRMAGGGFEPTAKNYEDRRKPYDNLFSKLYPNGTQEQYEAFYKDMDNRIKGIHASGKYGNSTQTSIPSNTPKIYGVNYDSWVYLNKNLIDPHDQLIVDRFGSGNDSDNWTDNDIKLIDENRARVEAKTRYYHDESLDVIPDKVVKTRKSTTSSTNRTPITIRTSPIIPAKEIQITPGNYIKDIDLFNKAGIRRGIPSIVDKTQFSNPSVNNRYSMFNRKTPLYSDLTIDPNLTKTPGLLEERVIPQKAPIRSNSAFKNTFKTAFNSENIGTTAQGVGALADIAGMIISNNALKNLKTPPPVVVPTGGYHTRYDDSAERANLADVTRMAIKSRKYGDSISSNASIKDLMNASWQQSNQIAGNKFNLETQLRNEAFAKDSRANELNAAARTQYNKDEFERRYQTNVANPQQITSRLAQHLGDFGNKLDVKHRDMTSMVTTAMSADNASFEAMAKAGYFNNLDLNLLKAISPEKYALLMKHKR